MKQKNYTTEDFCQDLSFWKWVKQGDVESKLFWEKWLEENPSKKQEVEKAKEILQAIHIDEKEPNDKRILALWSRIDHEIAASEKTRYIHKPVKKRPLTFAGWAAIFLAIAMTGIGLYAVTEFHTAKEKQASHKTRMIERSNPAGRTSNISLPDGTRIKLNSSSTIVFPEEFPSDIRQVSLVGEAFFDVAEAPSRPFIINTGRFTTTVLGTSFNISAYPSSGEVKVAVLSGKVFVENREGTEGKSSLAITREEMAVFNKASGQLDKRAYDYLKEIAWKDNIIHFEDADFEEIIEKLTQWYGVTFVMHKEITSEKDYTVTYENKSLETVLQGLSFVYDFEFTIDNKVVTIKE